jgi:hypothetical protein
MMRLNDKHGLLPIVIGSSNLVLLIHGKWVYLTIMILVILVLILGIIKSRLLRVRYENFLLLLGVKMWLLEAKAKIHVSSEGRTRTEVCFCKM